MRLNVSRDTLPIELYDEKTDSIKHVVMVCLDGDGRNDYTQYQSEQLAPDKEGNVTKPKNLAKVCTHLLNISLYEAEMDGKDPVKRSNGSYVATDTRISKKEINSWPIEVIDKLANEALKLSKLSESEDEAKND